MAAAGERGRETEFAEKMLKSRQHDIQFLQSAAASSAAEHTACSIRKTSTVLSARDVGRN